MTGHQGTRLPHLASLTLLALLAACSPEPVAPPDVPVVFVTTVRNDTGVVQHVLFGQVRPRVESELSFRTGGKITERLVELGQSVRSGQVLARLDAVDYQLALRVAQDQQRAAEVDADQAASDAARFKRLLVDGSVGAADVERQQARADAAVARLAQAQRQTDLARNRETYTVLTAPFDGVVTGLRFEVGQMVDDRLSVLSLAMPGELDVVVDMPEPLLVGLRRWQASARVGATIPDANAQPVALRLRELAPSANAVTRMTRARYALIAPGDGMAWRMGMSAEVRLQRPALQEGADLPLSALLTTHTTGTTAADPHQRAASEASGPSVWLVDAVSGGLRRQPVQLLSQTSDRVRVAGLADGDWVVTAGAHRLDAGMRVRPLQRPLAADQSTSISALRASPKSAMVDR